VEQYALQDAAEWRLKVFPYRFSWHGESCDKEYLQRGQMGVMVKGSLMDGQDLVIPAALGYPLSISLVRLGFFSFSDHVLLAKRTLKKWCCK